MKITVRTLVAASIAFLAVVELIPSSPVRTGVIGDAQAIIGRPATPVSYAGVARRTAVREVAVVETAAVRRPRRPPPQPPHRRRRPPHPPRQRPRRPPRPNRRRPRRPRVPAAPVGTVVGALPAGCVSAPISGVEYYLCNGTYYRAAFQGNNLVYVVSRP